MGKGASIAVDVLSRSGRWASSVGLNVLRKRRERATAREVSRECLRLYREVEQATPQLSSAQRYLEVVSRHSGLELSGVLKIVASARESFASWPVERPLCFRDVVYYLAAQRCLDGRTPEEGMLCSLDDIIAEEIPHSL